MLKTIKLWGALAAALVGLVLATLGMNKARVAAERRYQDVQKDLNDHVRARERERAGRKAVHRGRDSGDTPDERVRRNDDAWK